MNMFTVQWMKFSKKQNFKNNKISGLSLFWSVNVLFSFCGLIYYLTSSSSSLSYSNETYIALTFQEFFSRKIISQSSLEKRRIEWI